MTPFLKLSTHKGFDPFSQKLSTHKGFDPFSLVAELKVGSKTDIFRASTINTQDDFETLTPGSTCDLTIRLLPRGQGSAIIAAEDFDNFNPGDENIQTEGFESKTFESRFTVSSRPEPVQGKERNQAFFDITSPIPDQTICSDGNKFEIEYVINTQQNKLDAGTKLKYELSLRDYTFTVPGEITTLEPKQIKDEGIKLNPDINRTLRTSKRLQATLNYELVREGANQDGQTTQNNNQISGSIPFRLSLNSQCNLEEETNKPKEDDDENDDGDDPTLDDVTGP